MTENTRLINFANATVSLRTLSDPGARIGEFLFSRLPGGDPSPHVRFHIVPGVLDGELTLYREGALLYDGPSRGQLALRLVGDVIYHLADRSTGGLVLHAGAVSIGGRSVLLPGKTGAGKTSLCAWLTHRGFHYQTDELVFIAQGNTEITGFARPFNIKTGARDALEQHIKALRNHPEALTTAHGVLVPAESAGEIDPRPVRPLGLILFPRYQAGATMALRPLSRARTALGLMECLINARNLDGHGFPQAAALARGVDGYELVYGDFNQLGEQLHDLAT